MGFKTKDKAPKEAKTVGQVDIQNTIDAIKTKFGEEAIMKLGEKPKVGIDAIPTGSIGLDAALGVGGLPRGRIIEIFGPESSGKTTLSLHVIAEAQKKGGICAFIDAEHAMDPEYSKRIGVKIDDLLISQPDTGEQALEICESLVRSGKIDVVVVDSVAALTPKDEIEGDMGAMHVGKQARLMSQALRKLTAIVARSKTIVIFINQIRMQIGVMFGNPETTTGGRVSNSSSRQCSAKQGQCTQRARRGQGSPAQKSGGTVLRTTIRASGQRSAHSRSAASTKEQSNAAGVASVVPGVGRQIMTSCVRGPETAERSSFRAGSWRPTSMPDASNTRAVASPTQPQPTTTVWGAIMRGSTPLAARRSAAAVTGRPITMKSAPSARARARARSARCSPLSSKSIA